MLPKTSAAYITMHSENVHINMNKVDELSSDLSTKFLNGDYSLKNWKQHELNPKIMNNHAISWIFFMDTINFSFWPQANQPKFVVSYKGKQYSGYWSICAAVNRAIDNGIDITDPNYMRELTTEKFNKIFFSDINEFLPLVSERVAALQEAGSILIEKFDGDFVNCIKDADKSAQKLLSLIVENFSSYRDKCFYKNELVCFYKRAQILIADVWCCFEGSGLGEFHDIDSLTAFADYRVPQVLAFFQAIEYSEKLQSHLENKKLLENGDPMEVEIRGVTLQCIEIMVKKIKSILNSNDIHINSILVDNYLWDYRRSREADIDVVPMHRSRTIYY